jgi:hypothetical protein
MFKRGRISIQLWGQRDIAVEGCEGVHPSRTNEESDRTHPSLGELLPAVTVPSMDRYGCSTHYFEIYTRGSIDIKWTVELSHPFVFFIR